MTLKLVAGLIHYNDLKSMKRTIESIYDHVDHIITVDGKFSLREGDDYSTDGSTEYLESLDKVIAKKLVGYEHDKRNVYMEEATRLKADAVLIIDSDEYVLGDWEQFYKSLQEKINNPHPFLGIPFYYTIKDTTPYPRICLRPHDVRYWKTHNIANINNVRQRILSKESLDGIFLSGNDDLRSKEWVDKTYEYQKKMIEYEKPLRKQMR